MVLISFGYPSGGGLFDFGTTLQKGNVTLALQLLHLQRACHGAERAIIIGLTSNHEYVVLGSTWSQLRYKGFSAQTSVSLGGWLLSPRDDSTLAFGPRLVAPKACNPARKPSAANRLLDKPDSDGHNTTFDG